MNNAAIKQEFAVDFPAPQQGKGEREYQAPIYVGLVTDELPLPEGDEYRWSKQGADAPRSPVSRKNRSLV